MASGLQAVSGSSYYSEVTSPNLRTTVHSLGMVGYCVGVLLPIIFTRFIVTWRMLSVISTFVPILGSIHIFIVPESPAWLVLKGRLASAKKSLIKLRGSE